MSFLIVYKKLIFKGIKIAFRIRVFMLNRVIPPFLIELMGRKSKALLLFKNRWTTIY